MKTLNTLIISGLLAFSINTMANASDFEEKTADMNRELENRINEKIRLIDEEVSRRLQADVRANSQAMALNTSTPRKQTTEPKANRS